MASKPAAAKKQAAAAAAKKAAADSDFEGSDDDDDVVEIEAPCSRRVVRRGAAPRKVYGRRTPSPRRSPISRRRTTAISVSGKCQLRRHVRRLAEDARDGACVAGETKSNATTRTGVGGKHFGGLNHRADCRDRAASSIRVRCNHQRLSWWTNDGARRPRTSTNVDDALHLRIPFT